MTDILSTIAARSMERVRERKEQKSLARIAEEAGRLCRINPEFPFEKALKKQDISFICEIKKASPSKGVLDEEFQYLKIAGEYEAAGADAVSVLTEPDWFLGSDCYLSEIRNEIAIPILRKDFTVDSYQIFEAKLIGADAVLLICSLLDPGKLKEYICLAEELGLTALTEAHNAEEVGIALEAGSRVIGVNNRDLKTFEVDLETSIRLRSLVPDNVLFVSESGIKTHSDITRLKESRVDGVLIGETFMKSQDKKKLLAELRGRS
jgi:Indole-3-glycerol phosphate synthase